VQSLTAVYDSNKSLFKRDRRACGTVLVTIGYHQASIGDRKAAAKSFLGAAIHHPFQSAAYLSLARLVKGWESSSICERER
jgi:hypothetical protein